VNPKVLGVEFVIALLSLLFAPFLQSPEPAGHLVARVPAGETVVLRDRPQGRAVARLGARTEFGTPQALAVLDREDGWLGVSNTALPNERLGWIDPLAVRLRYERTPIELRADLSARTLSAVSGGQVLRRIKVTIGSPVSPTPIGRFAVTDKLRGADFGSYYGCCILAISGRQTRLPPGWQGGDLLAIHGGPSSSLGGRLSAGCLHAGEADLRWLMRRVPLGTPVTIHP
jgi:antitoxin (DNA-binding transcriptional repressor) of toxin-antitoxin stability system